MKYEFVFPIIGHTVKYHKGIDSVVGIVTPYGLEGSGFENRCWQEIFSSTHPLEHPRAHPPSCTMGTRSVYLG